MPSVHVSVCRQLFPQFLSERDTVEMSRLTLLVLTIGLLNNEVQCGTLGKISKSEESLMPRAREALPSNATQLNLELSSLNEVLVNASSRVNRGEKATSPREGKSFPIAFLAGFNIGGLASAASTNLASLAKITHATPNSVSPPINPYVAALYDPYPYGPPSYTVQQHIANVYRLLDRIKLELDSGNLTRNTSIQQLGNTPHEPVTPDDNDTESIDLRTRRKDKLKMAQKAAEKRRKEEREREKLEELEYDDDTEEVTREPQRVPAKKIFTAKQVQAMMNTTGIIANTTSTPVTNTTNNDNGTYPLFPGYYGGGNPQPIGSVGFTYDIPQDAYGPPAISYGPPSNSYGPPSNSYGPPFNNYVPTSNTYGTPPYANGPPLYPSAPAPYPSYGTPQYPSVQGRDPVFYEDPPEISFASSERWPQYPPVRDSIQFARSRKSATGTRSPPIANGNGFVPI